MSADFVPTMVIVPRKEEENKRKIYIFRQLLSFYFAKSDMAVPTFFFSFAGVQYVEKDKLKLKACSFDQNIIKQTHLSIILMHTYTLCLE